jgi:hypothetical protein
MAAIFVYNQSDIESLFVDVLNFGWTNLLDDVSQSGVIEINK